MRNIPFVTVLMSVFNGEKYLAEAIDSILQQTFTDFEFLIIDDASNDSSVDIISSYKDKRISLIQNQENLGLTKSLNKGLRLAKGKYIARMDADDVSLSHRLTTQVVYMEENPLVGICGTWFRLIPQDKVVQHPHTHQAIVTALFKNNAIGHPTSIFRKSTMMDNNLFYNETFPVAQDYELWVRAASKTQLANIPEVLVLYRDHEMQVSTVKKKKQKLYAFEAKIPLIKELLGSNISANDLNLYRSLLTSHQKYSYEEMKVLVELLSIFLQKNEEKGLFEQNRFFVIILNQYRKLCFSTVKPTLPVFFLIKASPCYKYLARRLRMKLFLKSLIGSIAV